MNIKERLNKIDKKNHEYRTSYKELNYNTEKLKVSMEEENFHDCLYLVYRNDDYDGRFYIFEDDCDIIDWLEDKWSDWDLWEYGDRLNDFFEEELVIWEFHRNICMDKWPVLYRQSKPFIKGWSRKKEIANCEATPSFSIN